MPSPPTWQPLTLSSVLSTACEPGFAQLLARANTASVGNLTLIEGHNISVAELVDDVLTCGQKPGISSNLVGLLGLDDVFARTAETLQVRREYADS